MCPVRRALTEPPGSDLANIPPTDSSRKSWVYRAISTFQDANSVGQIWQKSCPLTLHPENPGRVYRVIPTFQDANPVRQIWQKSRMFTLRPKNPGQVYWEIPTLGILGMLILLSRFGKNPTDRPLIQLSGENLASSFSGFFWDANPKDQALVTMKHLNVQPGTSK